MEEYGKAKRLLLQQPGLKAVVLNANDDESKKWDGAADKSITRIWTGIDESGLDGSGESESCESITILKVAIVSPQMLLIMQVDVALNW